MTDKELNKYSMEHGYLFSEKFRGQQLIAIILPLNPKMCWDKDYNFEIMLSCFSVNILVNKSKGFWFYKVAPFFLELIIFT